MQTMSSVPLTPWRCQAFFAILSPSFFIIIHCEMLNIGNKITIKNNLIIYKFRLYNVLKPAFIFDTGL